MEIFKKIRAKLSGKKTYIIAILMIILGILNQDQEILLEGIGLLVLRAGIAKIEK